MRRGHSSSCLVQNQSSENHIGMAASARNKLQYQYVREVATKQNPVPIAITSFLLHEQFSSLLNQEAKKSEVPDLIDHVVKLKKQERRGLECDSSEDSRKERCSGNSG